jgi:hypothetical protein
MGSVGTKRAVPQELSVHPPIYPPKKTNSGSVSQKTPWRGEMFLPNEGFVSISTLIWGKKNIREKKKKGKISIFFS